MPKRSAQEKLERYHNKIRKLEKELSLQNYSLNNDLANYNNPEGNEEYEFIEDEPESVIADPITEIVPEPVIDNSSTQIEHDSNKEPAPASLDAPIPAETDLDPEILSALGESTADFPDFGDMIHENLAKLWLPLLKKGLSNDTREKLIKEYLTPENCKLLQAPKLNAEISAAVVDMVRNRDKNLTACQQQLGAGITAVNRAMDLLMKNNNKVQAIKHLSDSCRILSDLHFASTKNRIRLLCPSLDKTFLHVIHDCERDDTLFGNSLSEKIKAAKAIEKQGLQIKKVTLNPKASSSAQPSNSRPALQGNGSGPSRYPSNRGGRGGRSRPTSTVRRQYATQTKPSFQNKRRAPTHQ